MIPEIFLVENCVGLLAKLACEDDQKIAELSFSALNALLQSGHKVKDYHRKTSFFATQLLYRFGQY